jgi:pimeloyl-ACP methyl ester carboxylesterase
MPTLKVSPDLDLFYRDDNFTDPWSEPETILMLHGNSESGAVWYGWMPVLARHFRIVRPDMRGFGQSTPMPADYAWSVERIIDDYIALMDHLGIERFHLIGAKVSGGIALAFAARHPDRVETLVSLSPPVRGADDKDRYLTWLDHIKRRGVESWARMTMGNRLGSAFPPDGVEWWIKLMGRTAQSTQIGFIGAVPSVDVTGGLSSIRCPTLVVTTTGSALHPPEELRQWQEKIPDSELLVVPGDSYHVSATHAEGCAQAALAFLRRSQAKRR